MIVTFANNKTKVFFRWKTIGIWNNERVSICCIEWVRKKLVWKDEVTVKRNFNTLQKFIALVMKKRTRIRFQTLVVKTANFVGGNKKSTSFDQ